MAFTVEDGSGVPGANSYAALADADAYFADRGAASWTGTDEAKQQALILATDYVEKRFVGRWRGRKSTAEQGLSWPRDGAVDDEGYDLDGVPLKLVDAVSEYALRALTADLLPDPDNTAEGDIKRFREKVGPIEEETEYFGGTTTIAAYPAADRLLRSLLNYVSGATILRA